MKTKRIVEFDTNDIISRKELLKMLNKSSSTLTRWKTNNYFPKYLEMRFGGECRYSETLVRQWQTEVMLRRVS